MAIALNRSIIAGRVGQDPARRGSSPGFVTFSVATSRSWKDRDSGERREVTTWHTVVVFAEATANFCEAYVKKGDLVLVEGAYESREYDDRDSGQKRRVYELVVRPYDGQVQLQSKDRSDGGAERSSHREDSGRAAGGSAGGRTYGDLDDEIPF